MSDEKKTTKAITGERSREDVGRDLRDQLDALWETTDNTFSMAKQRELLNKIFADVQVYEAMIGHLLTNEAALLGMIAEATKHRDEALYLAALYEERGQLQVKAEIVERMRERYGVDTFDMMKVFEWLAGDFDVDDNTGSRLAGLIEDVALDLDEAELEDLDDEGA